MLDSPLLRSFNWVDSLFQNLRHGHVLDSPLLHSFNWVDSLFQKSGTLARARQSAVALTQLRRVSLSKAETLARARQSRFCTRSTGSTVSFKI